MNNEKELLTDFPPAPFTVQYVKSYITGEMAGKTQTITAVASDHKESAEIISRFLYGQGPYPVAPGELASAARLRDNQGEYEVRKFWQTRLEAQYWPEVKGGAVPALRKTVWYISKSGGFTPTYNWHHRISGEALYTVEALEEGCPAAWKLWQERGQES